jgi:galactokinase
MRVNEKFQEIFRSRPTIHVRAPGRTNLIGEHIDYNGGHVLPIAIDRAVEIAATPRTDGHFRLYSVQFEECYEGSLPPEKTNDYFWTNYFFGVVHEFRKLGRETRGLDAVIDGDVPRGSGLSSSAAFEVAAAWLLRSVHGIELSRMEIALLGQRAENKYVGVNCGIMDQAISANGEAGHALLLDCDSLEFRQAPLDLGDEAALLVAHCGVHRGLSSSAYNQRRGRCDAAIEIIRRETGKPLSCLCAASLEDLEASKRAMDAETIKRARHAITEEARVVRCVPALERADFAEVGRLLNESHYSLRDDYEVSCEELDALTGMIREWPGAFGSRLTGAGFGGCAISLVRKDGAGELMRRLEKDYYEKRGLKPLLFLTEAGEGVRILEGGD